MGVIDCLSAGYRYLGWRLELILIPIVLDLLLWLGPRLNVAPLFDNFAASYRSLAAAEGVTPEIGQMVNQLADSIRQMGEGSNLLNGLASSTLLHVPGLPVVAAKWLPHYSVDVTTVGEATIWWLLFSLLGLLLGVIYLTLLARRLPIGSVAGSSGGQVAVAVLRHWLQVIGFVLIVALALLIAYLPISFVVGLMMLVSPAIGSAAAAFAGAVTLIVFFYLYFVVAALIMDNVPLNVAIMRSIRLVRENFWATLGFILLSNLIGLGIALLLVQLADLGMWAGFVAIVINAYVGTGLSMALLVFYRSRFIKGADMAHF
ncbi:MAG: hypothetical protein U0X20_24530 [Caldilineaceae bacterium]